MNWIKFKIHIFCEYYQDRKAWFKSLFCYKKVSRKYDEYFYFRGELYSEFHWHREMKMFFGEDYPKPIELNNSITCSVSEIIEKQKHIIENISGIPSKYFGREE